MEPVEEEGPIEGDEEPIEGEDLEEEPIEDEEEPIENGDMVKESLGNNDHGKELAYKERELETMVPFWR